MGCEPTFTDRHLETDEWLAGALGEDKARHPPAARLARAFPQALLLRTVGLHEWRPDGGAYAGLSPDLETAAARRRERFVVATLPRAACAGARRPPPEAVTAYTLDLRRI